MTYSQLTESQWRDTIVSLAETYGWRVFFVENSTREITRKRTGARVRVRNINRSGAGFPDLVLVRGRDRRLIFAELKRDAGPRGGGTKAGSHRVETSPEQEAWLADLRAVAGAVTYDESLDHLPLQRRIGGTPISVEVWRPSEYDRIERMLR